jgi:hypothetical protein
LPPSCLFRVLKRSVWGPRDIPKTLLRLLSESSTCHALIHEETFCS